MMYKHSRSTHISVRLCALIFLFRKYGPNSKDANLLSHSGWTAKACVPPGIQRLEALREQCQGCVVSKDAAALPVYLISLFF